MSTTGWLVLVGVLIVVAAYSAAGWWVCARALRARDDLLATILAKGDKHEYDPDYSISIVDWGPDFEGSDLGRWRWVIWDKIPSSRTVPIEVGNTETAFQAWYAVHSSILKAWSNDYYTPRLSVEWKKAGVDAASYT